MRQALLAASLPAGTMSLAGCDGDDDLSAARQALRRPLAGSTDAVTVSHELVRCATLAANGHNTQPWRFALSPRHIAIRPDWSRRTPVVDPDDHHLWTSLGCATENLAVAADALGRNAEITFDTKQIAIRLTPAAIVRSPLAEALFLRQSSRTEYDRQPLSTAVLDDLQRAGARAGVRLLLLTERAKIAGVRDAVLAGNSAQMQDPAFVRELRQWIRFNGPEAIEKGDGLFTAASGNPSLPSWLGGMALKLFLREQTENDKYAKHLDSSAGVAIFIGEQATPASWFEVGRAFERFALMATVHGVRTAFVNQPVEVPAVRNQFAQWLGLTGQRPDLVVRFGRGPTLPYSLRRPVQQVLV
jgi:hypothetical protein